MADHRPSIRAALILWILAAVLTWPAAAAEATQAGPPVQASPLVAESTGGPATRTNAVPLLGTMEFPGSLRALKKWTGIIEQARLQTEKLATCGDVQASCSAIARSWQQMLSQGRNLEGLEQLNWVNMFFNRWPYRLDMEIYGVSDYWATPEEFMRYSGDCEDYSIAKYFALRQLDYPMARLRIVVLRDTIRNIGHAVLAVYVDNDAYILDNMSNQVLSHQRYLHYSPYYSLNENNRWAHGRLPSPAPTVPQP